MNKKVTFRTVIDYTTIMGYSNFQNSKQNKNYGVKQICDFIKIIEYPRRKYNVNEKSAILKTRLKYNDRELRKDEVY